VARHSDAAESDTGSPANWLLQLAVSDDSIASYSTRAPNMLIDPWRVWDCGECRSFFVHYDDTKPRRHRENR